jgi:hypothetical protein
LVTKARRCELTAAQQDALKNWVAQTLPRTTTMGRGVDREILWRLIELLQRNEYRKPELVPRKLDPGKQQAFIDGYENLLNNLKVDGATHSLVASGAPHISFPIPHLRDEVRSDAGIEKTAANRACQQNRSPGPWQAIFRGARTANKCSWRSNKWATTAWRKPATGSSPSRACRQHSLRFDPALELLA